MEDHEEGKGGDAASLDEDGNDVEGGGDEEAEGTEEPFEVPCSVLLVHHLECVNVKRQLLPQTLQVKSTLKIVGSFVSSVVSRRVLFIRALIICAFQSHQERDKME